MTTARTLYDKLWDAHVVRIDEHGTSLLYIDRQLVHEVTSPQAFEGLRLAGRKPWRVSANLATPDHNVPTTDRSAGISDPVSRLQVETLDKNCSEFGITEFHMNDPRQGIVHVVGPEQGATLPGMTVVCGDSHTATHGAFGALAFGIGTSEVEHVMATQTLPQQKSKTMLVQIDGELSKYASAKDIALAITGKIGTAGGTGHVIEYAGEAITNLSMEGRMTLCNMAIEAGARAGLVAPDQKTYDYLKGLEFAPSGDNWDKALAYWQSLVTDEGAQYDTVVHLNAADIEPQVTWGTSPEQVTGITGTVPSPADFDDEIKSEACANALKYMDLKANTKITDIPVDLIFIGSCTNGRIEDFRIAAEVTKGTKVANNVTAIAVPGSYHVKEQAEKEGLDKIFIDAGWEWRDPGCSMCLAMNGDELTVGQRSASTSNRNFEGRQGKGGRTHLVSPAMAAAAASAGHFVDIRNL